VDNMWNKLYRMFKDKELRGYLGSAVVFLLIIGLLVFLAFFEIPEANNDIFKVIVGMLVGSLSVVIYTFIGKNPEEVSKLEASNASLSKKNEHLIQQKDELEAMHINLQQMIVEKLSIAGNIFEINDMKIQEITDFKNSKQLK